MSQYKIANEELVDFARKIYEEACCGYLDLKDSVCDRMVREFIDGRQIFQSPITDPGYLGYQGHPGPDGYAGPENNPSTWTYTTSTGIQEIQIRSSDNATILRDEPSVSPREENQVRENNPFTNYEGNESERF